MEDSFEKIINVCCHSVIIRFWDIEQDLNDDLIKALEEEGESRARDCISRDYSGGELNCLYLDEEIRGWWEIQK